MVEAQMLACKKREITTRGYFKQMVREGWVPGIVYGMGKDNLSVFVGKRQLKNVFGTHGSRGLFSLEIEGNAPLLAVVREVQKNPLSGEVVHLDFMTVNLAEKITSMVGVIIIGEEELMKKEGIVQSGIKEIEISCLPQELPGNITCSVAELSIGDKITVADLEVPEGVEIITEENALVAMILAPSKAVEEPEKEAGGEGAQETTPEEGGE